MDSVTLFRGKMAHGYVIRHPYLVSYDSRSSWLADIQPLTRESEVGMHVPVIARVGQIEAGTQYGSEGDNVQTCTK